MSTPIDDPDHEEVVREAKAVSEYLESKGYHFVHLCIAKAVHDGALMKAPGTTTFMLKRCILPAIPSYAESLRKGADEIDRLFRESGAPEAEEGWVEKREWEAAS